jgi:hypothetical protein
MLTWKIEEWGKKQQPKRKTKRVLLPLDHAGGDDRSRIYSFVPARRPGPRGPGSIVLWNSLGTAAAVVRFEWYFSLVFRIVPNGIVTKREKQQQQQPKQKIVEIEASCWCVTHSSSSEETIFLFLFLCTYLHCCLLSIPSSLQ